MPTSVETRRQRELRDTSVLLGPQVEVRALATGRANARWSNTATWIAVIFGTIAAAAFIVFHVFLLPGILIIWILYDAIRPRRGVAVTTAGLTELRLGFVQARPVAVVGEVDHSALSPQRLERDGRKLGVRFGTDVVSLSEAEAQRLQAAVASIAITPVAIPSLPPLPLPPPPDGMTSTKPTLDALPWWRKARIGPVLLHVVIGVLLFVLGIAIANVIGTWLGRDVAHTSDAAIPWLWLMVLGAELGWMAFVYARRTFRVRLLLFGAIAGGALLAGCIANYVYSPPLPGR